MYKKIILFVFALIFVNHKSYSQVSGTINLGPDFILPVCKPCTTLKAITTPASGGTSSYLVNQIQYTPYPYIGGTVVNLNIDDSWSSVINIPFEFCFFDSTYTKCIIGSNGQISFDLSQAGAYCPWGLTGITPLPNATFNSAKNSIMAPYHDIQPAFQGSINYQTIGVAPNRKFVVSWSLVPMFSCTQMLATQQIVLFEGANRIETYIANKPLCANWNNGLAIHGIENRQGTIAFLVPGRNLPTQWTAQNDAWEFVPNGGGPGGGGGGVSINWYENGNLVATNVDSLIICPTQTSTYEARAIFTLCGGFEYANDTVTVTKQDTIQMKVTGVTDVSCFGLSDGSISFSASGGTPPFTYTVNGNPIGGSPAVGLGAGTYTVVLSDANNCTKEIIATVNQPDELNLAIAEQKDVLCKYKKNGYVKLVATGGTPTYDYWYGNTPPRNYPEYIDLAVGDFRFYVKDNHGCIDSVDTHLSQPDSLLSMILVPHVATCKAGGIDGSIDAIVTGGVAPYTYEWDMHPKQYTATATGLATGVYTVVATDVNGCITASQAPVDLELTCNIYMPTAFTPNGDGKNDIYRILDYCGGVILGEFKIYNRWGVEVFSTRDLREGWDGFYKGQPQDNEVYNYVIIFQCNEKGNITQKIKKGDFVLLR